MIATETKPEAAGVFEQMFGWYEPAADTSMQIPPNSIREFEGTFELYESRKRLVQTFPAQLKHANPLGNLQGGVISALIDDTMGPLSFAAARAPTTTINLSVNYLRAITCPDTVRVDARVTGRGRTILFLEAEVYDSRGRLAATGTSSVMILKGGPPA